ncbi:MAG: hydroxyacid dehydrogenase [Litoricolaceae bacterium]|jgi:(S)-sulfolactate dehydrogenase|nr:hydroxyacid dehydrogenase [Litorivicinaceae bacterium]
MATVLVSEFMDGSALAFLENRLSVDYAPNLFDDQQTLMQRVSAVDALIVRNRTPVTRELLNHAGQLKVIGRLGVGLDNIDLDAAKQANIQVLPATGANAVAVAEYVMSALLHLRRPMTSGFQAMVGGDWPREQFIGGEISGKTLGLIGFGQIAQIVAKRAAAFGMRIAYFDPYIDASEHDSVATAVSSLDELLALSDSVSIHVPLTEDTHRLMNSQRLALMKSGAILINTSRGGIVDERALIHHIQTGHLGGAALDVFEHEPLDELKGARFDGIDALILTPHIAGVTHESNRRVSQVTAENVLRALGYE